MEDAVRKVLEYAPGTGTADRTIDITTTGRRSGEPRRIETVFYRVGDETILSGIPAAKPRGWLVNLAAEPQFVFHVKHGAQADLPARAEVIEDPAERRRLLEPIHAEFAERHGPDSPWPAFPLEEWLARAPLARVTFP